MSEVKSTCCYCGVGCGVVIEVDGGAITGVRGDPDHPANHGRLCSKGATLHLSAGPQRRVLRPELRPSRTAPRAPLGWPEALEHAADRFATIIREHGPDAVAFYISGQLLTEDYYVFNKLAKGLIGTNNVDTNSRLCMSSAVAGYKATLGADAPPACYEDIDHATCLLIVGSNTAYAHPVLYRRIEDARRANPSLRTIVVDPRITDTAREADLHLAILPGTDVALLNGMLYVALWEGLCDLAFMRDHTEGFDALKETLREYTPAAVAETCGIAADDIVKAARWFAGAPGALSLYCQGVNQSANGTQNNAAIVNLHLATGQIGRAGAGPFSLTGQPNAMGGREVGGMANLLSAHRDLGNAQHRAEVAALWGVPSVPGKPGKTAVELFDALRAGSIKAVWIACTNPAQSMPAVGAVAQALSKAEFVVLQECFGDTDTAAFADLLLPASTWGEKEGTVTNSERRISRVRRAIAPLGEARADWEIARDFALALGRKLGRGDAPRLFAYPTPESIFNEHRETTRGRDLDITGLDYATLESDGPQQWPYPAGAKAGRARLYENAIFPTPSGRARFVDTRHKPSAEKTDARHPLHLSTGRLRDQWHGMSRTGRVARLFNHVEEPLLSMSTRDMDRRQLRDGDLVKLRSRRGSIVIRVAASADLRPGQAFMPMHWGRRFLNSGGANVLTLPTFDPVSRQPELKHAAVQVEKVSLPWQLVAMRVTPPGEEQELLARLQPLLARFDHASLGLFGRERPAVLLRAASAAPVEEALLNDIDAMLALDPGKCLSYADARRGISKRVMIEAGQVAGVRLTGETAARDWLKEAITDGLPADAVRRWVLAPVASLPQTGTARGRIVCACENVGEREIEALVSQGAGLEALKDELRCGTGCGSCVPELKAILRNRSKAAA